jgi:hypothetical protein
MCHLPVFGRAADCVQIQFWKNLFEKAEYGQFYNFLRYNEAEGTITKNEGKKLELKVLDSYDSEELVLTLVRFFASHNIMPSNKEENQQTIKEYFSDEGKDTSKKTKERKKMITVLGELKEYIDRMEPTLDKRSFESLVRCLTYAYIGGLITMSTIEYEEDKKTIRSFANIERVKNGMFSVKWGSNF